MKVENSLNGACSECTAKCCRNYVVAITAYDIARLVNRVGSLACVEAIRTKNVAMPTAQSFFLFENGLPEEYILCLRRDNAETCVFLGKDNFCSVYGYRPMTCRVYPFQKSSEGGITYKEKYRCPISWNINETVRKQFLSDIEKHEQEFRDYGQWCREWNATLAPNGSFEMFLKFMVSKVGKEVDSL